MPTYPSILSQQRGQTLFVVRGGKVVWTYSIPGKEELGDCTMLSNGNIVFSRRLGASEITPDKKIVRNYEEPPNTEVHTTYPIGKERVLIMQNGNPAKLLVIHKRRTLRIDTLCPKWERDTL